MATLNPHQREALDILRASSLVKSVSYDYHRIRVLYKSGLPERYFLRKTPVKSRKIIPKSDLWLEEIPTYCEFESRPFDDVFNTLVKPFFCVQYDDFAKAGFLRIRLKIQEIISNILEEGWVNPRYPTDILEGYWKALRGIQLGYKIPVNRLAIYRQGYQYSLRIILNFIEDINQVLQNEREPVSVAWKSPSWLRRSIESCLRKGLDVTRVNIIARLSNVTYNGKWSGINFINPLTYRVFFNDVLRIKNPRVLHLNNDLGSLLLGTGMAEGSYRCLKMSKPLSDMASLLKIDAKEHDGGPVDICFDGLQFSNVDQIEQKLSLYRSIAKTTILCIKPEDVEAAKRIAKPDRVVKITLSHWKKYHEGLFIYSKNTI